MATSIHEDVLVFRRAFHNFPDPPSLLALHCYIWDFVEQWVWLSGDEEVWFIVIDP